MLLSVKQAQAIVDEMGAIVHQKINMMDENGYIIASTDPSRIGNFHQGAKKIIDNNLSELYITSEEATSDTRMGINLPLYFNDRIIGVIGITGTYDQVIGYGRVVKKMTEILIRERAREDKKRLDLRVTSRFLEEWLLGNGILRPEFLTERGKQLGIDIALTRRVLVVSIDRVEDYIDTLEGQKLIEAIEDVIYDDLISREPSVLVLRNAARQIILLPNKDDDELISLGNELKELVGDKFAKVLRIGVDGVANNMHEAYLQANKAWRIAQSQKKDLLLYNRLNLEMFLHEISPRTKFDYLEKMFRLIPKKEIESTMELLEIYFASDGSLNETAARLFLHKNTLQYKLKRLEKLTGCDVRKPRYAAAFYMALLFYRENHSLFVTDDN